jgi:hypothetical protein
MDKVQKPSNPDSRTPQSEPTRIQIKICGIIPHQYYYSDQLKDLVGEPERQDTASEIYM